MSGRLTRVKHPGTNKWYQSRTSAAAGLTAGDDGRFGDGRQQQRCCGCLATIGGVVRTVREVSGTSWPTLTCTNYGE